MSHNSKTTLFFIVSPKYKITATENFLKKRNYEVYIETDIKTALLRLIEVQPDFVFIALDHPNPKIDVLPQIIDQCLQTNIVPFLHSNTKDSVRKLDDSAYLNKIFPPLSGPAIERMTIRLKAELKQINSPGSKHSKNLDVVVDGFLDQLNEKQNTKTQVSKTNQEDILRLKEKNSFFAQAPKNKISQQQKDNLKKHFQDRIQSDLCDILETCQHEQVTHVSPLNKEQKTVFCLLVQSKDWSGHLMAYSNANLERSLLEPVFRNWIAQEFQFFNQHESHVFFEIEIDLNDFKVWVENKAEYFETLKVLDSELMLSFVGIEPSRLLVDFDEANDLITVDLDWVPLKTELNLTLFLHLPENKKFLLYTPQGQQFSDLQKQRLIDNRVDKLHTPIEFEDEVKKLKMIRYLQNELTDLNRKDSKE